MALADPGAGPQVVIGLTAGRSDDPTAVETRSDARGDEGVAGRSRSEALAGRLEILAEPILELVSEREQPQAQVAAEGAEPLDPTPQPEPTFELVESSVGDSSTPLVHTTSIATPSEISIPPAGDLSVEPEAERFFSAGELVASDDPDDEEWDHLADKAARKSQPEVVQRRARFSKYVRWAVGGACLLCLAALARTAVTPPVAASGSAVHALAASPARDESPAEKAAAPSTPATPEPTTATAPAEAVPAMAAAAKTELTVEAPRVDVPAAAEPAAAAAAEPAAAAAAEPAAAAAAEPAAAAAEPAAAAAEPAAAAAEPAAAEPEAPQARTARQEKNDSRRALERGKAAEAIAAGERSVALDPSDGEAWLLLGAAYQEKGKMRDARRAYAACLKEGKRGPLGECRAMLR